MDDLYPIVKTYLRYRCFGREIDWEKPNVCSRLRSFYLQEGIAKYLARKIGELTAEIRPIKFKSKDFRLSKTDPFTWRRNLPLLSCNKTIFNLVATYNDFEKDFAQFLESATDIARFAALGTTEQESGTCFRVDYLKPSGATGFYFPDWVAVQQTSDGEVNWIIETKGRVWEGTKAKDQAIRLWCEKVTEQTGRPWRYLRVNQTVFQTGIWGNLEDLVIRVLK
jgi:type III restriction enzyme